MARAKESRAGYSKRILLKTATQKAELSAGAILIVSAYFRVINATPYLLISSIAADPIAT